jgi:hypothetical protein
MTGTISPKEIFKIAIYNVLNSALKKAGSENSLSKLCHPIHFDLRNPRVGLYF